MNFNLALYISTIAIGILIIYVYGIVTVRYKVFPYKVLRKIKRFIFDDARTTVSSREKNNIHRTPYYLHKKSFFEEHSRKAEIVMLGDSLINHAEWRDLFPSKIIANYGISGDTTAGVLDRIDSIYKINPTKVFIMVGINDLMKGELLMIYIKTIKKLSIN